LAERYEKIVVVVSQGDLSAIVSGMESVIEVLHPLCVLANEWRLADRFLIAFGILLVDREDPYAELYEEEVE
jgi:hypothetical protein